MLNRLLVVTATGAEAGALLQVPGLLASGDVLSMGKWEINLLITGVGAASTSWEMAKWISSNSKPDLAINMGIAGSFNENIEIGEVVVPVTDCFADLGIESESGFMTISEAGLAEPDRFPFRNGRMEAANQFVMRATEIMKPVNAITVNTASGTAATIEKLKKRFNPDIETMEGATFFYICCREMIPFMALRSISNRVEPRNKKNWDIPLAVGRLSEKLKEFILLLD